MARLSSFRHAMAKRLRCNKEFLRIFMAELCGTAILLILGDGAVAQAVLSRKEAGNGVTIALGYGMAISMGIYVCGGASGGHINPAVTLAMCLAGNCSWKLLPAYWIGQYLGAFIGAATLYGVYSDAISALGAGKKTIQTAGIFATYPIDTVSTTQTFFDQVLATAVFLIIISAVTDEQNMQVPKHLAPLSIGLGFFATVAAYGYNCGGALNPARDFGPRLFTSMAGWGSDTFNFRSCWFWVPIFGPHLGAVLGVLVYQLLVGIHWPPVHQVNVLDSAIRQSDHMALR